MKRVKFYFHSLQWYSVLQALFICGILSLANHHVVHAKTASGELRIERPQSEVDSSEISRDQINDVARGLWCPLCSGVRLDTCELKACEQMRQEIAIQLAEGSSAEEIQDYFLDQYGPQVLGKPTNEGFNRLAWIVPIVALLGGAGYLLFIRYNQWQKLSVSTKRPPSQSAGSTIASQNSHRNDYEVLLEQELKQYDS
ncbi:MAG: cytochrome c-type biogenesis protein CcmH [Chloroflexota bacterium]